MSNAAKPKGGKEVNTNNYFLSFRTAVVSKKMHLFVMRQLAPLDITPEQWAVLSAIKETENTSQRILAELTEKDRPTVNRIMDVLLRKELVEKCVDEKDRRKTIISLTELGIKKIEAISLVIKKALTEMFKGLTESEIEHFLSTLQLIEKNIEE